MVNLTESKVKAVQSDNEILVPGYSVTKYRAEKIVLGASGCNLANGTGKNNKQSRTNGNEKESYFAVIFKPQNEAFKSNEAEFVLKVGQKTISFWKHLLAKANANAKRYNQSKTFLLNQLADTSIADRQWFWKVIYKILPQP